MNQPISDHPKISVVIPIYNVEDYLGDCLKSIIGQTLKNLQIICVNDGSTDNSASILLEHSKSDHRIEIISQKNRGLSCARNIGAASATGEYIYFMDSDDILDTEALESLYTKADVDDLDLLCFNAEPFTEDKLFANKRESLARYYHRSGSYTGVLTGKNMMMTQRVNGEYLTSVCLQLIRRSLFQDAQLRFLPGILYEDNAYTFAAMIKAKRVGYDNHAYFKRRIRTNSITTKLHTFHNAYSYYAVYLEMARELSNIEPSKNEDDILLEITSATLYNARNIYAELDIKEQSMYKSMPLPERISFMHLISDFGLHIENRNDLNAKLKVAYTKKSELNAKLQKTYAEKSELNAKLQKTYAEKSERVLIIEKQKEKLDTLNQLYYVRLSKWFKRMLIK